MNASEEGMKSTFEGMFGLFKLAEFPKNAVQTPNLLILSCRCCCSDFVFVHVRSQGVLL